MFDKALKILTGFIFVLALCFSANAQGIDASTANGKPDPSKQDLPEGLKETLAKQRIKSEEKEYQELVKRGEEAAKLGEELNRSLENAQQFSAEDVKRLERLEKLVKKIREELGAKDEDLEKDEMAAAPAAEKPSSLLNAVKNIKEDTANLLTEIKKIGRHSISVVAIESSNALLKLVRFLRFNKK